MLKVEKGSNGWYAYHPQTDVTVISSALAEGLTKTAVKRVVKRVEASDHGWMIPALCNFRKLTPDFLKTEYRDQMKKLRGAIEDAIAREREGS